MCISLGGLLGFLVTMEGRGDKEAPLDPEGEPVCGCWEE